MDAKEFEENQKFTITDDEGNSFELNFIMSFEDDGKVYVVAYDDNSGEEKEVFAFTLAEDGTLTPISDDNDWELVQEELDNFLEQEGE